MKINSLTDRITNLAGVSLDEQSPVYKIGTQTFISNFNDRSLTLHMTPDCYAKLVNTFQKETRVQDLNEDDGTVTFSITNDVDQEFVFLYIRFAWKYWRPQAAA